MTLSGNYEDVNAALLGFTFTPDPDFYGIETILVTAEDDVTKNLEINILGQNDPVELSYPGEGEGTSGNRNIQPHQAQAFNPSSRFSSATELVDMVKFKYNAKNNGHGNGIYHY